MGRKPKLDEITPEQHETFVTALELGLTQKLAAELIGQSPDTVRGWMARGKAAEEGDDAYAAFFLAAKQAEAGGAQNYWEMLINHIKSADPRDAIKGLVWLMERRYGMTLGAADADRLTSPTEARSITINLSGPEPPKVDE